MREQAASERPVALPISLSEKRIELRHDLTFKPCLVTLTRMLARPAAIAAMSFADRFASHSVYGSAAPWIVALGSLRREHFASRFDRAESMLAPCLGHARLAMTPPALEHRLAAYRARNGIGRARFDRWRVP